MYKAKKFISYMALCVLIFSLCACGEKGSENAAIYGETVGGLEDNELFAIIDTNASLPVLLVTSQVYNDGLGNQAALNCDVYYLIDKEVKNIGTIESIMRRKDWYGYHIERTVEPKTASVPAVSRISRISDFALERMRCINFGTTIMVFSW